MVQESRAGRDGRGAKRGSKGANRKCSAMRCHAEANVMGVLDVDWSLNSSRVTKPRQPPGEPSLTSRIVPMYTVFELDKHRNVVSSERCFRLVTARFIAGCYGVGKRRKENSAWCLLGLELAPGHPDTRIGIRAHSPRATVSARRARRLACTRPSRGLPSSRSYGA